MALRDTVTVVCRTAVDGARTRRSPRLTRARSSRVETMRVDPDVMLAANAARRPGEHLVLVSPTRVDIVAD